MAPRKLKCWPRKICERVCNNVLLRKLAKATLSIYIICRKMKLHVMLCKCIFIFAHQHVVPPTSDIARNSRKCGESCAKASRKLRYLNQALLWQTATLGSSRWIKSHVFNVRPLMKGCDSFIVKWQGPPRKLAKEVFVRFILAKEKIRSRKSGERFWRKAMWLEQNHTRFSTQLNWNLYKLVQTIPL